MSIENFKTRILSHAKSAVASANAFHVDGIIAVKKAYSNEDFAYAQCIMDNTPRNVQGHFITWFKRCGIEVMKHGTNGYKVVEKVDNKKQAKMFELAMSTPVIVTAQKDHKTVKPKELIGDVLQRATKKIANVVKATRAIDEECAALINDTFTKSVLFRVNGQDLDVSMEEADALAGLLISLRMEKAA